MPTVCAALVNENGAEIVRGAPDLFVGLLNLLFDLLQFQPVIALLYAGFFLIILEELNMFLFYFPSEGLKQQRILNLIFNVHGRLLVLQEVPGLPQQCA